MCLFGDGSIGPSEATTDGIDVPARSDEPAPKSPPLPTGLPPIVAPPGPAGMIEALGDGSKAKLAEIEGEGYLFSPHDPEYLDSIRQWAKETETGDRGELKQLPEDLLLWRHLDARRETCTGQKCPDWDNCFVTLVRKRALESDIIIVNHHLFFADLALRQGDFGSVLPDYSVVIFDEAHELEDVATQYFGVMVSNYRLEELVRDADKALKEADSPSSFLLEKLAKLAVRSNDFFNLFRGREGRFALDGLESGFAIRRGRGDAHALEAAYRALHTELAVIETGVDNLPVRSDSIEALARRSGELQDELAAILESDSTEHVYWYESRGRGIFLWASPICVSSILRERLFSKLDTVVLTSATLSTGGNFEFIRSRLGFRPAGHLLRSARHSGTERARLGAARLHVFREYPGRQPGKGLHSVHKLCPDGNGL